MVFPFILKGFLLHFCIYFLIRGTIHIYDTIHIYGIIHIYDYYSSDVNKYYQRVVLE